MTADSFVAMVKVQLKQDRLSKRSFTKECKGKMAKLIDRRKSCQLNQRMRMFKRLRSRRRQRLSTMVLKLTNLDGGKRCS